MAAAVVLREALAAELAALPPALRGCPPGGLAAVAAYAFCDDDYTRRCVGRTPEAQLLRSVHVVWACVFVGARA
jgi:hypothetical protein